nr:MAG TPA: nucleoside triphosphate pyrophosphohydrolase [Caudoviricetes sp.]
MDRQEVYRQARDVFGAQAQLVVALEELSEAQKEICKFLRGKGDLDHLTEEIADAQIMLEQVQMLCGIDPWAVQEQMDSKIRRLRGRIKEAQNGR